MTSESCLGETSLNDERVFVGRIHEITRENRGFVPVEFRWRMALNDNRGSIDWIDSGCKPTKKLRHENLAELGIAEAKQHGEVSFYWIPGKTNPADIFAKEDNDVQHCCSLRDLMVMPREAFGLGAAVA